MSISTEIMIIVGLVLANGVFAMAEIAIVSLRRAKIQKLVDRGNKNAMTALKLSESPTRFLSTVQFGITLVGILSGAVGGATLADKLTIILNNTMPWLQNYSGGISIALVVCFITVLSLILGELVPKRLAMSYPETISLLIARPMDRLSKLGGPLISFFSNATDSILGVFGVKARKDESVSEEEVTDLIEQGMREGVFEKAEKEMVEGVLSLDKLDVEDIMTPRAMMVWLHVADSQDVNWRKIVTSGHSHFPVYEGQRDHVIGMISVKALYANVGAGVRTELRDIVEKPLVVPETLSATKLLDTLKKSGKHIALVANEFGTIEGLVTLNDVLEAIVGDIPSLEQRQKAKAVKRDDGSWLVDAIMGIEEFVHQFNFSLPTPENGGEPEYETLAGFVVEQIGHIPSDGEKFDANGYRFEIVDMDRHRVDKILVTKLPEPPAPEQEASA